MSVETSRMPARRRIAATGTIRYVTGKSAVGVVLLARSPKGVCAILLGSTDEELVRELKTCFPGHQFAKGDGQLVRELTQVVHFIGSPWAKLDLELDMGGTPFQRRVWEALRAIPRGATVTYRELAKRIGSPTAVRAVGRACASNVIAIAIPCHRVRHSDGSPTTFRWGADRKRKLIELETMH